jgi:hypothetical protein
MQSNIGKRIVFIGRTLTSKQMSPYPRPIVSQRAASHRLVIIKDGEFVGSRLNHHHSDPR